MRMSARGADDLKLAAKKLLMVLLMGFRISRLGLLFGFHTANRPRPFQKEKRGAQQPTRPRPIELWSR